MKVSVCALWNAFFSCNDVYNSFEAPHIQVSNVFRSHIRGDIRFQRRSAVFSMRTERASKCIDGNGVNNSNGNILGLGQQWEVTQA